MKAYSEKGSNQMKKKAKAKKIPSLKNRESISQKLGMGIEPTYSSSAGWPANR
jgi:hypothetical protein